MLFYSIITNKDNKGALYLVLKKIALRSVSKISGIRPYMANKLAIKIWDDFRNERRTTFIEKMWAYRRGFTSSKIIEYGLNEDNYKNYLSEFEYYKLFPLNENYSFWINDKVTVKYVLSKFSEHLPEYYFHLRKGNVFPAMDWNSGNNLSISSLIDLLTEKNSLAVKQESGSLGAGFYKLEYINSMFKVNGEVVSKDDLTKLLNSLDSYLVSEYIANHDFVNNIFSGSANCVRLQVIKDGNQPAYIANSFMRFGTSKTGGVDSPSEGAVFTMVDIKDGSFGAGKMVIDDNEVVDVAHHPDTKTAISGTLPYWDLITKRVLEMADYLGHLTWMGFDVVITNDGFKIFEINSHQAIERYQYYYPLLKDNPASDFLNKKIKEKNS